MGLDPVQPTSTELDSLLDPSHHIYGFYTDKWSEPLTFASSEEEDPAVLTQRLGNADAYKQHGCMIAWHRYTVLGFFVFDDCNRFERYWRKFVSHRLLCYQMIWYNYMCCLHPVTYFVTSPNAIARATQIVAHNLCSSPFAR